MQHHQIHYHRVMADDEFVFDDGSFVGNDLEKIVCQEGSMETWVVVVASARAVHGVRLLRGAESSSTDIESLR